MSHTYVLDRYTANYYKIDNMADQDMQSMNAKDFLVFEYQERGKTKTSIGQYLGYDIDDSLTRSGSFARRLLGKEKEFFHKKQKRALQKFPIFKKEFRSHFSGAKAVTARYQIFSHQTYFYFHSDQRYVFGDFLRTFQQMIGTAIFFFQVGSRDMVRLSHVVDEWLDVDGRPLHYSYTWPLPSIEMDDVAMQGLEGRDIERLKDRSGRLDCSMIYEKKTYQEELKKYPYKGQNIQIKNHEDAWIIAQVQNININTGEVSVKTSDGLWQRLPLEQIKWSSENKKKNNTNRRVHHKKIKSGQKTLKSS